MYTERLVEADVLEAAENVLKMMGLAVSFWGPTWVKTVFTENNAKSLKPT